MNVFAPARSFDQNDPELIDRPGMDRVLLREELQMLEDLNRRLCGHQLAIEYVQRFLRSSQTKSLDILDLGTGAADIPRAIAAWARQKKIAVTITAVDGNAEILQFARESSRDWPEIRLEQHDLRSLPYAENSFDLVLCSLALHHFNSADAVAILRRISEIARIGYAVNDLRRNWLSIWATQLLMPIMVKSRTFQHDAVQSSRAAFTVKELCTVVEQAGLKNFQINRHHLFFHMVLAGEK